MNGKGKNIVLIVLCVLVVLLAGYICYDKFIVKESNTPAEEKQKEDAKEQEEIALDIQSRLVQGLYNKVKSEITNCSAVWIFGRDEFDVATATEEQKMRIVYNNIDLRKEDNISCAKITGNVPSGTRCTQNRANYANVLHGEYVRSVYKDIFGSTDSFQNIDFGRWAYVAENDLYVDKEVYGDGTCAAIDTFGLIGAKKTKDTIELEEKYIAKDYNQPDQELTFIYTFRLDDDGLYSFVSRTKAQ